ncbi:glycoside hydrolase family 3 N-terminal domain-containing protein [Virgibacillus pantothenticus]|uniref:Glycosyl hydrolase family 3 n=1 Tax=Virgibacillus pantothenticus TaxID=1473 RepID=A0A0L0QVV6_VIRPA|nr:glycoside hydrolase family 3 N-terminal domain-containing protein [Virgibacillus pantothenticus]KNE22343.1 glycosyl hydrolase family 3 [Virgibacillus pantothenticus]MED3735522.1 glycoside hydrolase family 3 N-terminal domain-containing protein [Virgibacillus pantothenticus]QTY16799.1 glycoside hydrolase family 3 C-terminal domain-containing protein [Virgibacillus pantothenticus]SIS86972.1 beta-glucosidase [Virgibacillus pantothenticus]
MNENKIKDLLRKMTLNEKIGQVTQLATPFFKGASDQGQITGPMKDINIPENMIQLAGSVLGASGAKETKLIQKQYLQDNRLGIPLLIMSDIIHGYKTIFPVPLAIGSSWDLQLAEKSATIAAKEAAVSGVHVTFAPMVDLVRDPRWGRVVESTGEDPYLNSVFAKAQVRGFQGTDLKHDHERVASCVKHFAGYGAAEGGRDYNTVNMSERDLRESYLLAFKAALEAGSELVMTAFNTVDGIPASGNKWLMRDLLREEWKFDGVVISDWGAVKELIPHGVAEDEAEAAAKALSAGVDIEMMTDCYANHLQSLIESNQIDTSLLDEAVMRILELKDKLGLFDHPFRGADEKREAEIVMCPEHRQVARELATKSCVLLQNKGGILPLHPTRKVGLIGPFANNNDILGPWSWLGAKDDAVTLYEGIMKKVPASKLVVANGCGIDTSCEIELAKAIDVAKQSDVIVLALGESSDMSGEAGSRANIQLPHVQLQLVEVLVELGKPTVAVLFNGRPLDLHGVVDKVDAVLEAWYPGTEGGSAIADILFGEVNPSGKITMSFPYSVGQIPVYYNNYNTGRPKGAINAQERYVSQYLDCPNEALFPFGYGLSYTSFDYSNFILSSDTITPDKPLTIKVKITNTGDVAGEEVVQLYVRDLVGEVVRSLKELKGFKKIYLQPGEEKEVTFMLTEEQLRYYHADLSFYSDEGKFEVYVGPNSRDVMALSFELRKTKGE